MRAKCEDNAIHGNSAHYFDHSTKIGDYVKVNNEEIGYTDDYISWYEDHFMSLYECPFCSNALKIIAKSDEVSRKPRTCGLEARLWVCDTCTYWQFVHLAYQFHYNIMQNDTNESYISKLNEYPMPLPFECHEELSVYLRRHPELWNSMPPRELELLVASIFRANHRNSEVIHVGRPDDGGVDVLFVDSEQEKWLIQVKRRESSDSSEGVSTLRHLLGTMLLNNSMKGIIVSTADHFTYRTKEAVGKARELGYQVDLVDRGVLHRMLDPLLPPNPWMNLMQQEYDEELCKFFEKRISCCYLEVTNDDWHDLHNTRQPP